MGRRAHVATSAPASAIRLGSMAAPIVIRRRMALIVDIRHWLDEHGQLPSDNLVVRRRALRIAQLIEAGGPLAVGQLRETLIPCSLRPNRKPCLGLLWVEKVKDEHIYAYCLACEREE